MFFKPILATFFVSLLSLSVMGGTLTCKDVFAPFLKRDSAIRLAAEFFKQSADKSKTFSTGVVNALNVRIRYSQDRVLQALKMMDGNGMIVMSDHTGGVDAFALMAMIENNVAPNIPVRAIVKRGLHDNTNFEFLIPLNPDNPKDPINTIGAIKAMDVLQQNGILIIFAEGTSGDLAKGTHTRTNYVREMKPFKPFLPTLLLGLKKQKMQSTVLLPGRSLTENTFSFHYLRQKLHSIRSASLGVALFRQQNKDFDYAFGQPFTVNTFFTETKVPGLAGKAAKDYRVQYLEDKVSEIPDNTPLTGALNPEPKGLKYSFVQKINYLVDGISKILDIFSTGRIEVEKGARE